VKPSLPSTFALYLTEGNIEPEVVENMRTRARSGFNVDQYQLSVTPRLFHCCSTTKSLPEISSCE
jgi:hypothetical protein